MVKQREYRDDRLEYEKWQRTASIEEYLKDLTRCAGAESVIGNIHGYTLPELKEKLAQMGWENEFTIANMTRNPIDFVHSYKGLVQQNHQKYPEKYDFEHAPRVIMNRHILERYTEQVDNDIEMQGFIEGCVMLNKMIDDLAHTEVPVILMERLTTEPKYFNQTVAMLSDNSIWFTAETLQQVFNGQRLNSHKEALSSANCHQQTTEHVWQSWHNTKQKAFLEIVGTERLQRHVQLGYDFSFL